MAYMSCISGDGRIAEVSAEADARTAQESQPPSSPFPPGAEEALGYLDMLYGVARSFTGESSSAQDLVLKAISETLKHWDPVGVPGEMKGHLLRELRSAYLAHCRISKRRTGISTPAERRQQLLGLVHEEVREAALRLPGRFREPVLMADLEGWSYPEVACALGCTLGEVIERVAEGRERIARAV
jgi:RNA polymerase sigma-70 factor (ECF subfamily)